MASQSFVHGLVAMWLLQLGLAAPVLKIHFMGPPTWEERIPHINAELKVLGLNTIEQPFVTYAAGNLASETAAIQNLVTRISKEPNSASIQNVALVYPDEAVYGGDLTMYEPIMLNSLLIWFGTYLHKGSLGPLGTVVVSPDDRKGGVFVAKEFCARAEQATNRKELAILSIPDGGYFKRYEGFKEGLNTYCSESKHPVLLEVEVPVDHSKSTQEGQKTVPTVTLMRGLFTTKLSINAIFSPSQWVTLGVIRAAKEVRGTATDIDGLTGLMLNSWHNASIVQPYVRRGKIYADVESSRSTNLAAGLARFLKYLNMKKLPAEVLTNVDYVVPSMEGFTKEKILDTYDKMSNPPVNSGAVPIGVAVEIQKLTIVDHVEKEIELLVQSTVTWRDRRLQFRSIDFAGNTISYGKAEIWFPKLFMKSASQQVKELSYSLGANKNGEVTWVEKLQIHTSCPSIVLDNYPHDEQNCPIQVSSAMSKSVAHLVGGPSFKSHTLKGGGFLIEDVELIEVGPKDIEFMFTMKRDSHKYWTTHKFPGLLFVCLGFLAFWIPPKAVPARVALGAIMVLSTVSVMKGLPGGTILDQWFTLNLVFIVLSFVVTVAAANEKINESLKRMFPCCSPKVKDEEAAKDSTQAKPGCCSEFFSCCCGNATDMVADRLGRRYLIVCYVIATVIVLVYMETL